VSQCSPTVRCFCHDQRPTLACAAGVLLATLHDRAGTQRHRARSRRHAERPRDLIAEIVCTALLAWSACALFVVLSIGATTLIISASVLRSPA
jgi:hypothetical protein